MAGLRDKAMAYLRVSGKGQVEGHGFDRQRDNILDYAKRNGVEVVGWFEEAYTGTKADRPVFAEMLAEVLNDGVRMIIVESMDRLARDLGVQIALLAKLRKARQAKRVREGRCEGRKPYGQTEEGRRIIATIKRLRRKPKAGKARGYQVIADILNADGVAARRGGRWYASTVRGVCLSDAYRHARVGDALAVEYDELQAVV